MKLNDLVNELSLEVKTCKDGLANEVLGAYVSDLLSDVMGNSKKGDVWITLQIHLNIVAVAGHAGLAGIIIVGADSCRKQFFKKPNPKKSRSCQLRFLPLRQQAGYISSLNRIHFY